VSGAARWIAVCLAAGLALRLAFGLVYWTGKPLTHDEREYLALGRSLARGDGFTYPADEPSEGTSQRFGRAPGYPAFLALLQVKARADAVPARVKIAQGVVGTIGIWLMALIAWRCGGPRAAAAAAAIGAIYPPLVWMPAYALSECLYSTLALAAALALTPGSEVRGSRSGVRGSLVLAAVLVGVAILVRPAMVFFVPLGALWLWRTRSVMAGAVFVLVIAACLAPWVARNARAYGRPMLASEGGVTFWTGNHPLAAGDGDLAANPPLKAAEIEFRGAHPGLTPEQLEPLYYRAAVDWMRTHPKAWLALEARKAFYTVVPIGPSYTLHSARYTIGSVAAYLIILPAAIVAAFARAVATRGARGPYRAPVALWLMAAATVLAGLVFFPQERFRIPVIDPALIISAAMLASLPLHERTGRLPDV
jgi:hypothetical protein